MAMFPAARNVEVHGGTHIAAGAGSSVYIYQDQGGSVSEAFRHLSAAAAHTALHDCAARYDAPRCHKNTRKEHLSRLETWMLGYDKEWCGKRFVWLNGGAGAGKSAIMQSIVERCAQHNIVLGSFFFSRTDPTRDCAEVLIPTLAYQLVRAYPEAIVALEPIINGDPLVFKASLITQMYQLLVRPILHLVHIGTWERRRRSMGVFVIDGLDECTDPRKHALIISAISILLNEHALPVSFLVASRPELTIQNELRRQTRLHDTLATMTLDNDADARADIRQYINDAFHDIVEFHPLRDHIRQPWPTEESVNNLVRKSSGHFIYATIAMKFIASHSEHPERALKVIEGLMTSRTQTPFAELDALYHHVLTSAKHSANVINILRWCCLTPLGNTVDLICHALDISQDDLELYLSDVQALVTIGPEDFCRGDIAVGPKHASLYDFFTNEARAKTLYMSREVYNSSLLPRLLELLRESPQFFSRGHYEIVFVGRGDSMARRGYNALVQSICTAIKRSHDVANVHSLLDRYCPEDVWRLSVNEDALYMAHYGCVPDEIRSSSVANYMSAIRDSISNANNDLYLRHFSDYMDTLLRHLNNSRDPLVKRAIPSLLFSCDSHSSRRLVYHICLTVLPRLSRCTCPSCATVHFASPECLYLHHLVDSSNHRAIGRVSEAFDRLPQKQISWSPDLADSLRLLLQALWKESSRIPFPQLNGHKAWLQKAKPEKHVSVGSPKLSQHVYYYHEVYHRTHAPRAKGGERLVLGSQNMGFRVFRTFPRWKDIYESRTTVDRLFVEDAFFGGGSYKKSMHKAIRANGYRCILILRAIIVFLRKAECTKELATLARKSLPRVCLWFPDLLREARAELDAYVRCWEDSIGRILEKTESMTISKLD